MFIEQLRRFQTSKHVYSITLFVIVIFAAILRLINFTSEPLWYDEVFGVQLAYYASSYAEIMEYAKETFYSPLYYISLRPWLHLFENNAFYSRLPSLVFSLCSVGFIYFFGKRILGRKPALISALIMALAPLQVEFGQEARPYAIFAFVALLSMYYFWKFIKDHRVTRNIFFVTLLNVVGLYMHYDYFILVASQISIICLIRVLPHSVSDSRILFKKTIFWSGLQGIIFLPWFFYALLPSLTGISYSLSQGAPNILNIFFEGDLWFNVYDAQERVQALLTFIGQAAVITTLSFVGNHFFHLQKRESRFNKEAFAIFFLVAWYLSSLLFYFISPLSGQYTPNWQRHIIVFSPPLFLLIGYGVTKLPITFAKYFTIGIIVMSMLLPLFSVLKNDASWSENHDISPLRYIEENEKEADLILIPGTLWEAFLLYHFKGESKISGFLPKRGYNSIEARKHYLLPAIEEAKYAYAAIPSEDFVGVDEIENLLKPYSRVWLIFGTGAEEVFKWFIINWNLVDCPIEHCPSIYLFERPANE